MTAVTYSTNCQPVPTFQIVEYRKFKMNSKILPECVVNEQRLIPVSALHSQQDSFALIGATVHQNQPLRLRSVCQLMLEVHPEMSPIFLLFVRNLFNSSNH